MALNVTPTRRLGRNGPLVPAMGFGMMMATASQYGALPDDADRFALLDHAVELGATFWDTADLYGDNEELLAKWFKKTGKRDQIFLASKFGYVRGSPTLEIDTSPEYCKKACNMTLEAMGIDCIDLYYVHNVDTKTPIEETMRALAELQAEGKIKHIGLSTVTSNTIRRAVKVAPVAAYQPEYSLFSREIEGPEGTDALATCRELGIAIVAATPLGRGMLTSTFSKGDAVGDSTDMRAKIMPRFLKENRDTNIRISALIKAVADKKGCTVSQLALAWLLKQGDDIFPIPGTKRLKYLEENWRSQEIVLSDEEEAELRAIVDNNPVAGSSVPPQFASFLFRDTKEE